MKHLLMGTAAVLILAPQLAGAQSSQNRGQPQAQGNPSQQQAEAGQPVARKCLNDLQAFRQQMRKDGLWLNGYRTGYGWHGYSRAMLDDQTAAHSAPGTGNTDARAGSEDRARAAGVQAQGGGATGAGQAAARGPWDNLNWTVPPMQQLRALQAAVVVMAQRGEQQGCETVLAELRQAYDQYGQQLKQAGGNQDRMSGYRQQQLANATPVGQMDRAFRADNLTGTDVRNAKDEYLGSIEDVVVDPNSGQVSYVILARGGFFGVGEDYVAVPWKQLKATQNMDAFVLNTTDTQLEKAPKVDLQTFSDQQTYIQRRQEIDRFWQQQDNSKSG
ncbi:PRC-barrel domain-containing protein [Dankookia sp. GCM10030260]|uniref:PRC-barrel domain-containing protein n=1 Tax=Dankookia sp. GCM10030260 TaxID=3273390 RepID=UPI00360DDD9D